MPLFRIGGVVLGAAAALGLGASVVLGKDARCFTTDDGEYPCDFQPFGGDGSFTISAPGKPTYRMTMTAPGVASASAVFEQAGRSVLLPGSYRREASDPACWLNDSTATRICAW